MSHPLPNSAERRLSLAQEQQLDTLAHKIVQLRLQSVVQFVLEAHLPFVTILNNTGLFLEPLLRPLMRTIVPQQQLESLKTVFSSRQNVVELLKRIEEQSLRTQAKTAARQTPPA